MRKNQMVFIAQRGWSLVAEKYEPEEWNGKNFYAITLKNLIAYKKQLNKFNYPELYFYVITKHGHLQTSERNNIKKLLEFTNKQLREFFN